MANTIATTYNVGTTHPTWDFAISSQLPALEGGLIDFGKRATPTLQVQWSMKHYAPVNTDYQIDLDVTWGGAPVTYGVPGAFEFDLEPFERRTRLKATPVVLHAGTSVTPFNEAAYKNSLSNLIQHRYGMLAKGFREVSDYETWAKTGEETLTNVDQIAIDDIYTFVKNEVLIKKVPSVAGRLKSMPFLIRPHVNGHTVQEMSTVDNVNWRAHCFKAAGTAGGDPLEFGSGAGQQAAANWLNTTATDTQVDMLIDDTGGNTANLVFPDISDVDFVLEKMQTGNAYTVLIACPPAGYSWVRRQFYSKTEGRPDNILYDMGLFDTAENTFSFRHSEFNAIFYADVSLSVQFPYTMWFYDPELLYMACIDGFGPLLFPWHHIPASTIYGAAKVAWMQRVVKDRKATGFLTGCQWR